MIPILRLVRCWLVCSLMPLVGAPAVCLHASVISVGPAFSSVAFFLVFPGLLSSLCVCVCVCVCVSSIHCLIRCVVVVDSLLIFIPEGKGGIARKKKTTT